MGIKIYEYKNCSTCKKSLQFLDKKGISYETFPIVDQPPKISELKAMVKSLKERGETFKKLFNTSGVQYRELKIADKIKAGMSESEALDLLSKNGKLIKRPFLLSEKLNTVGFKEDEWKRLI